MGGQGLFAEQEYSENSLLALDICTKAYFLSTNGWKDVCSEELVVANKRQTYF